MVKRFLGCTAVLVLAFFSAALAATSDKNEALRAQAQRWIREAESAAGAIEDEKQGMSRQFALTMVAATYAGAGEIEKAKAIAEELPEESREECLRDISMALAWVGDFARAVDTARSINSVDALLLIAMIRAKTDPSAAVRMIEELPEESRAFAYLKVIEQQVLAGDVDGATATASRITGAEDKKQADCWITAAKIVDAQTGTQQSTETRAENHEEIGRNIAAILEAKAKAGKLPNAEEVLKLLVAHDLRAAVLTAVAEYEIDHGSKEEARQTLRQALAETAAIESTAWGTFAKPVRLLAIAQLQVKAGDFDAGVKTIQETSASAKAESEKGLGVFEHLGGRAALAGLLILADRVDEALKMATHEDGSIDVDVLPVLVGAYAAQGNTQKADELVNAATPAARCRLCLTIAETLMKRARGEESGE